LHDNWIDNMSWIGILVALLLIKKRVGK